MNNSTEIILTGNANGNVQSEEHQRNGIFNKKRKQFLTAFTILAILTAYFAWATHYYIQTSDTSWKHLGYTTCKGYGLLLILYCFVIFGYLNVYILQPFIYPVVKEDFYTPFVTSFHETVKNNAVLTTSKRHLDKIFYVTVIIVAAVYLAFDTADNRYRLIPIVGIFIFLLIGYVFSNNKSKINWRTVIWGIILQFVFGLITIRWEVGRNILDCIGDKVNTLLGYAFQASEFPFGEDLVKNQNVFAFKSLSTIYFVSFLVNILYFYGIMQKLVLAIGSFLQFLLDTSICESVNSAANIFLGMTEAPLLLSPYLKNLTDSEIHSVMTSGFATVAGSVMAGYISYGARPQDLITSSIMSAPAALCFSKLLYPETEEVKMRKENIEKAKVEYTSVLDAALKGVANSVGIVQGIIAGIIAFLAAVYFINGILGWLGELVGYTGWTLEFFVGKLFVPISYVMGVPWDQCEKVGTLIGIKTMVNEFVAFQRMGKMLDNHELTDRTKVIATYAICGFSNPGSIGIMTSGLSTLIPNKADVITKLVLRAWFGGALVCFMTACIAGALMPDDAI